MTRLEAGRKKVCLSECRFISKNKLRAAFYDLVGNAKELYYVPEQLTYVECVHLPSNPIIDYSALLPDDVVEVEIKNVYMREFATKDGHVLGRVGKCSCGKVYYWLVPFGKMLFWRGLNDQD